MSMRKIAAQAALLQFIFLSAMFVTILSVMSSAGSMDDWDNPTKAAQMMLDHKSTYTLLYGMDWFFAITVFILAAAYTQKFSRKQPWLGIVIGGCGVMSSALFLTAGTIGIYGIKYAAVDASAGAGLGVMKAMMLAQSNIEMSGIVTIGVVTFAAALASARTKSFPAWVNWAGFIGGFCAIAGMPLSVISPMLATIGMLGIPASILFNLGVAMAFMKKPQPELDFAAQMA